MKNFYIMKIHLESSNQVQAITSIIGRQPTRCGDYSWELEFQESDFGGRFNDCLNYIESILKSAAFNLEAMQIKLDDISIWILYEYDEQCNLEFPPDQLRRLSELGVSLCISCWQA